MSTSLEIANAAKRDPLVYGINYVDLLDGKKWKIDSRAWSIEPYQAVNPYLIDKNPVGIARKVAITKSTQAGISTLAIIKALHFLTYWKARIGYMLPRQKDLIDFSSTRLDPVIRNSEFLTSKLGQPDSVYTKRFGNGYLFFLEGSVEPRSMPIDMLLLDEVDLCEPNHVGTALNRLDDSPWKLIIYLSTPTLPFTGIDAVYETSDQREWLVPCPYCNHKQYMDWDKNLRIVGPANEPERVYYGCVKCDRELTTHDMQNGEWVPAYPDRSSIMLGYHISQMFIKPAPELYSHYRDPQQSTAEFYRKRLGKPYTFAGGSLDRDDFLTNCFDEPYDWESMSDGKSTYYMGVDQGNQLQVVVGKVEKNSKRRKPIYVEIINFEDGFTRVGQLMRLFKVKRCVIDGDPNRHPIKDLQKEFPGRVLIADYIDRQKERYKVKATGKINTHVTVNRTEGFDDLTKSITESEWGLPGDPSRLHPDVELLIDQVSSIKRDIVVRKTQSGDVEVGVWRSLRADHLAHSMLYLKTAMDIDRGKSYRFTVVGSTSAPAVPLEDGEDGEVFSVHPDRVEKIIYQLAEVSQDQLSEYLVKAGKEGYTPPFPLSYKLSLCAAGGFSDMEITYVIELMII